jgi:hypothetical protein
MKRATLILAALTLLLGTEDQATAALVGFWSGNGNAVDSTGNNNGTLVNGATFGPSQTAGQQAFSFDGSSYVEAGTTGLPTGNEDRTLDLWFNVTSNVASESFLAGYGAFGTYNDAYELLVDNGDTTYGVAFSQWGDEIAGPTVGFGQWHNLAVTNVGDSVSLYLDGALVGSKTMQIDTSPATNFYIGDLGDSSIYPTWGDKRKLDGFVDDVALFNTALSASQIQSLMASETVPEPSTLTLIGIGVLGFAPSTWRRRNALGKQMG